MGSGGAFRGRAPRVAKRREELERVVVWGLGGWRWGIGEGGLGMGDWGWGIGDWGGVLQSVSDSGLVLYRVREPG